MNVEGPKSFGQAVGQASQMLRGLSASQQLLLLAGTAAVAGTLWLFVGWMAKPRYVTLYSGMSAQDAQQLGTRLGAANIPYELSPDGTVLSVPADQLDNARVKTAAQGLPRGARLGFEVFDTPNWAGSDFTEKVNYQRALVGARPFGNAERLAFWGAGTRSQSGSDCENPRRRPFGAGALGDSTTGGQRRGPIASRKRDPGGCGHEHADVAGRPR
jgi:hypothetical protein